MSCFVCRAEIFKSVAKVCFQYGIRQITRGDYPLTIGDLDEFAKKLAELNCKNVAIRYDEEQTEAEVEGFTDVPLMVIKKQEVADCLCWLYQTEDYCDNDPLFKMVKEATEWAKLSVEWKDTDLDNCRWG
jgi:hypothetical protein